MFLYKKRVPLQQKKKLFCISKKNHVMKIVIINGPNLNLLGTREPGIYGFKTLEDMIRSIRKEFPDEEIVSLQSNVEGEIINWLQEYGFSADGIILNAGGYTHTSVAIADAVAAITTPVIEVHISNIFAREEYRHVSLIAPHCTGSIIGFGTTGYSMAVNYFVSSNKRKQTGTNFTSSV